MYKLLCGVGFMDVYGDSKSKTYKRWHNMISRSYSGEYRHYVGITVCKDWLTYSKFKEWYVSKCENDAFQLDKDIIIIGNKLYSPETCCFVHRTLNSMMASSPQGDYLMGTCMAPSGRFTSRIKINGLAKHLGMYITELEAHEAYKRAKVEQIKRWLPYVKYDMRIVAGLESHIERLEDANNAR